MSNINDQDYSLSNLDLDKFIKEIEQKGANIFETNKIKKNTDIEKIFAGGGHAVLFAGPRTSGHWMTLLRDRDNNIYFIDSLAEHPDEYNKNILKCIKQYNGLKIFINKTKLQLDDEVTCGRYPTIFIACHKMGLHPSQTIDFLINGKKKYKTIDNFIYELTKKI